MWDDSSLDYVVYSFTVTALWDLASEIRLFMLFLHSRASQQKIIWLESEKILWGDSRIVYVIPMDFTGSTSKLGV